MTDPYGQPTTSPNGALGTVAFAISVVTLIAGMTVRIALLASIPSVATPTNYGALNFYLNVAIVIAHGLALLLGLLALTQPGTPRLLPGMAIGISGALVFNTVVFALGNWLMF